MDWYRRKLVSRRVDNTPDAGFCVDCLKIVLDDHEAPEIFDTGQGAQSTSKGFTGTLENHGVLMGTDNRGRALDNIFVEHLWRTAKYENVYITGHDDLPALEKGLEEYFGFHDAERPHQAMGNRTPDEVYPTANGGGARIAA